MEYEFHPMIEEKRLMELLELARKQRDQNVRDEVIRKLVNLYVSQGEYFKMADEPNPNIAKRYLKKALQLQEDHPVANYRLGYLYYRDKEYTRAVNYFDKAIAGSVSEVLNDTQMMLANMFLVNCGIKIAKEAIREMNDLEDNPNLDLENERIERYKKEILVLDEEIFDKMFYRKIENGKEEKISEHKFSDFIPDNNQVILRSSDLGMKILFGKYKPVSLNPKAFYTLYGILTAKRYMAYSELKEIATNGSGQKVSDDYIRQIISRLSRDLPYWDQMIEMASIQNPETGRNMAGIKLREGYSSCILCRADDFLPSF